MNKKYEYEYERCMVGIIEERAQSLGMTHADLGRTAFADAGNPVGKWQAIKKWARTGPAALKVRDAVALAHAVGMDLPSLAFQASERMKARTIPGQGELIQ
jgi:hypothetical protein